ncbi:hypothetical protein NIES932_27520 [Raphidiopsis curvata NIES-932]|nr:hypothetical protein NIES932_27520 [Raphidiopsis curvata NIES-932]
MVVVVLKELQVNDSYEFPDLWQFDRDIDTLLNNIFWYCPID